MLSLLKLKKGRSDPRSAIPALSREDEADDESEVQYLSSKVPLKAGHTHRETTVAVVTSTTAQAAFE